MKLRRRIGSVFLAFAMALSLIPSVAVSALAADDNAEIITQVGTSSRYRVDGKDLAKMLVANDVSANADVNAINIHFKSDYKIGANYGRVFGLYMENPVNTRDWVTSQDFLNRYADVRPDNIDYLEIQVKDGKTIQIKGEDLTWDCKQTSVATYRYHLKLKNAEISTVTFWYQPAANLHWTEYATVTVKTGSVLGDQMPDDPKWIAQHFAFWEIESSDGTGDAFTANTVVTEDMNVYARKVSAGGGSAYHVMDQAGLITYIKDHVPIDAGASVVIENISIVGKNNEATNPDYFSNGWKDEQTYYYIYNADASADDITPQYQNTRVPVDEITNMILTYTVGDSTEQTITIPRNDFVPKPLAGGAGTDVIVEIWLNEEDAEGSQNVAWSINYYVDDALSQTETGAAAVGTQITASKTDSYAQYLEYPSEQTKTLTVGTSDVNVLNLYYYTDANNDDIPDIYQFKVTYQIVGGTWDGSNSADKVVYVTKQNSEGAPAATGTATLGTTIPDVTNATPGAGFSKPGAWADSINSNTVVTQDITYTYSFTEIELGSYNVNYHIVGDVGTRDWTVSVQAGTEYTYEVPGTLPGYTFDGWYEKESDIGNTDKKEPTTVTVSKKYEVYGKYVINTENPPKAPDEDAVIDLLGRCVQLKCDQVTNHKCGFELKQGSFIIGNCTADSNVWTVTVTVNADKYLDDYNTKGVGTHGLAVGETGTRGIVLTWDATANNNQGAWVRPTGELLAIFDVTCKPDAPTTDDLNKLFPNGVQVDCISQSGHPNKDFSPVADDTYTTTVEQKDGKWTCKVTVTGASYVEQYVADIGWLHTANDDPQSITLVWENGKWAKQNDNNVMVVFDVTCQAPDAPTYNQLKDLFKVQIDCITSDQWGEYKHQNKDYAPIEDSYTLGNATANADGTWDLEVTVAAEKYVAQYSEDRDEAHELADKYAKKTVTLVYQDGAWSKLGDDIAFAFDVKCNPKYNLVYYGCGGTTENGKETVSSTFPYFGEATIKNNPFLRDGYVFEGWALEDGGDVVYTGGEDVTFNDVNFPGLSENKGADLYAVWALDKQGAIDPDTGEETGDGIADYRQVFVRYKSADATLGSVAPAYQVVTLDLDENGDPIVVDIPLDSVATANEGAEFIYWMQGLENTVSYEASLKNAGLTLKNYTPGYTYEFTAYFMDSDIGKPEPVQTYKIDVDVTNGTGTFFGTEVTTHILAMEGEDITIAFAPDAGYALDTVTVDGEPAVLTADGTYTFPNVAANHSITVVYATDAWNDKDDTTTGGDGIPDKYQVVVKYVADKGGKITGKQVEVLTITVDGHYSTVGDVTATGSQAAAFHNWDFSRWVAPNSGVASWDPTLDQQTIENAEGGNTYVFTAHFRYDPYIPPVVDPDPDDPTPPPVNPNPPQLNTEDHYAYIVGYEDGTVRPEGDITRAEVATIFFRLLTDESRDEYWSQTNDYIDVAEGDWYNNAVSTLSKAGILNGYEDGSFQPNGNITRAEFATIAARFFEATYEGEDLFPDIEDHWARDYINQAAHAGIVNGYPNGTFQPQENITRAEAMTIVNRTLDRHPDADHFLADMITWPDNLESAWYYEQVQEATNSHEYTMHTDDEQNPYEIWTELLPVRDWAQLEKEWSDAHSGQSGGDVV